ncbi:MAG TPA: endonuclease MutS2, partial [Clostridia bacterium]|nr:endonuclease MutS2 [Clostridia bacterium]
MNEKTLRILEYDKIIQKLASLTASELGRELAEAVQPERSFSKVQSLLKETNDGVSFIMRRGSPPLGGIHDIRPGIKRADLGSILSPGELLSIADTLRAARNLKSYSTEDNINETDNTVKELINCLEIHKRVEEKIKFSILSEDEIADGASTTLSNIRRQMRDAQNSIKEKLNGIVRSSKYQKYMQESIVTMRGDRYVVPVKQEYRTEIPGLVHDS